LLFFVFLQCSTFGRGKSRIGHRKKRCPTIFFCSMTNRDGLHKMRVAIWWLSRRASRLLVCDPEHSVDVCVLREDESHRSWYPMVRPHSWVFYTSCDLFPAQPRNLLCGRAILYIFLGVPMSPTPLEVVQMGWRYWHPHHEITREVRVLHHPVRNSYSE
jgi:hypothetical protein